MIVSMTQTHDCSNVIYCRSRTLQGAAMPSTRLCNCILHIAKPFRSSPRFCTSQSRGRGALAAALEGNHNRLKDV